MNVIKEKISDNADQIVTIKSVSFSKTLKRYCLTIEEEQGKIILEHDKYFYLIEKFGVYTGQWRNKQIKVDEDYIVIIDAKK